MRMDQWHTIQPLLDPMFNIRTDNYVHPARPPYSRNPSPGSSRRKSRSSCRSAENTTDERSKNRLRRSCLRSR
jgi:hypothetical protein